MSLFWQREKRNIDRRQSLEAVPVLNRDVETQPQDDDTMVLRVTFTPQSGWLDRFRPRVESRRYELDAFGAFVLRQIDGQRTVIEIVNRFEQAFGMSRRESELGVVAFIKMLIKRGLLAVGLPAPLTPAERHAGGQRAP